MYSSLKENRNRQKSV